MSQHAATHSGGSGDDPRYNSSAGGPPMITTTDQRYQADPHFPGTAIGGGNSPVSSDIVHTNETNPRAIHVAHRRSPSELTALMLEQLNLQRQLEIVQAQQQHILQAQQQLSQRQAGMTPAQAALGMQALSIDTHDRSVAQTQAAQVAQAQAAQAQSAQVQSAHARQQSAQGHRRAHSSMSAYDIAESDQVHLQPYTHVRGHSRSHSRSHSRAHSRSHSQSFRQLNPAYQAGHSRRHSLGLSEARQAAAEVQLQRSQSPTKDGVPGKVSAAGAVSASFSPPSLTVTPELAPPPGLGPPAGFSFPSHGRSHSSFVPGASQQQRGFQFPARPLAPPQPGFAGAQPALGHRRFGSSPASSSFVPGHRNPGSYGGSSVSSIAQFQNGQRKSLFAPYLPQNTLPGLIAEGRLVTGTLRVNKKNRSDAYVSTGGLLDADIFICGSKDRNRALEGDLVAVELLVVDEVWSSKREKEEKKRLKENGKGKQAKTGKEASAGASGASNAGAGSACGAGRAGSGRAGSAGAGASSAASASGAASGNSGALHRRGSLKQRPTQKKNDDVEVEGQSLLLAEEEEISDEMKPLYAGHIVAVIDRIPGQLFSGTLGLLRPSQAAKENRNKSSNRSKPKIVWFKPTDKKVPLIAIPTEQAPDDFVQCHAKYAKQIFVASIKRWPITSLHPFGTLVSQLGSMDDSEVEVTSILRDNNFQGNEYPERACARLAAEMPSAGAESAGGAGSAGLISAGSAAGAVRADALTGGASAGARRDLTREYVLAFSEDGDLSDHAMHVKVVGNDAIELGVHVADVSYFVPRESSLDKRARKRSHGVVLPQRTVGLLPDVAARTVSFDTGKMCLAVSVIFRIDSATFEIQDVWIGETVVRPAQKISYAEMDGILAGAGSDSRSAGSRSASAPSAGASAAAGYVTTLQLIADRLRKKRLGEGADTSIYTSLLDRLDDEAARPTLNIYEADAASCVLGQIFHAVNAAVAQRIHAGLGSRALLRRFPMPTLTKFEAHLDKIRRLGVNLDTSNAVTFQRSLLGVKDPVQRDAVQTILVKCMPFGRYVTGQAAQGLGHYLMSSTTYTHFTAPLRRYADIVVQRQLKAVIHAQPYPDTQDALKVTCDYCNFKKDCARAAQEQAIHLLLCQTVNNMARSTGQVLCTGVVLQAYESSFDVYLPEFGIEKRVHGDTLPLRKAEFDKEKHVLELYWEPNVDAATYVPEDETSALSYRASIRNKYRAPALKSAQCLREGALVSAEMEAKLGSMHVKAPVLDMMPGRGDEKGSLQSYLGLCKTRVEGDDYIETIAPMQRVPVMLRAEIGMALPCLTVRTLNPFVKE